MAEQITIEGHMFNVPIRYEEGHELTANEASALNQTFHENLRNNFAKKVKDRKVDGQELDEDVLAELQTQLDDYADKYEFGARTGGGGVRDPIMSEAMNISRGKVLEHLRSKGIKRKDVDAKKVTEYAKALVAKNPKIMELARARVAETQAAAAAELDSIVV
jgi:hypothetical protein